MVAALGSIVTTLEIDRRNMGPQAEAAAKDLMKVRGEVSKLATAAAQGNAQAALSLHRLIEKEEQLASVAKRAAEIEVRARQAVIGVRREELHILAMQEQMERRVASTATASIASRGFRGRAGAGAGRAGFAIQQAGFGIEDFLISSQTSGLAGGLRAVTNNLSMAAMAFGPKAAAITAVGAAITSVAVGMYETAKAAKTAEQATESLVKALEKAREVREGGERLAALRSGTGSIADQKARVADARGSLADVDATILGLRRELTAIANFPQIASKSERLALEAQLDAALTQRKGLAANLEREEFALREGEASERLRRPKPGETFTADGINARLIREHDQRMKLDDRINGPARAEASRMASIDDQMMAGSILAALGNRLRGLIGQRDAINRMGPSGFPEAAERGQSMSKILEIIQKRRGIEEQKEIREQTKKLEKQIDLLERLIDTIKERMPTLKQSRA